MFTFHDTRGEDRAPLYISKKAHLKQFVNLLYFSEHYAAIKNFSRFAYDITCAHTVQHFCMKCFHRFTTEAGLTEHDRYCSVGDFCYQLVRLPYPNTFVSFKNFERTTRFPFTIYADFECLTEEIEEEQSPEDEPRAANTRLYQKHTPASVGLLVVCNLSGIYQGVNLNPPVYEYETYTGRDVVDWFLHRLAAIETVLIEYLHSPQRMIFTAADGENFNQARACYICRKAFRNDAMNCKVRDHNQYTGEYLGAAHNQCNLLRRRTYKIPVFLHNFRGYDSHLICRGFTNFPNTKLFCIAQTLEKYLMVNWGSHLVFKDSLQFLSASLETLAHNLAKSDPAAFKNLNRIFSVQYGPAEVELLQQKEVYPYDFVNSWDRLLEQREQPSREQFFNKLATKECSADEYAHFQNVWRTFGCTRFLDYHNLYLKTDVLLLADVFESFRDVCMKNYKLDPTYYLSAPNLSWDVMLKTTDEHLELICDPEMYRLINASIRGGISMVTKRYAKANNKYLGAGRYDPSLPSSYIIYLDANNLYGWAMSQPLPHSSFRWLLQKEITQIDWLKQSDTQKTGYIVTCDLEYPAHLHNQHNDYPLGAEQLDIYPNMLSKVQEELRALYDMNQSGTSRKLVPNLYNKLNTQFTTAYSSTTLEKV